MLKIIAKDLKVISDKLFLFLIGYSIIAVLFTIVDKSLIHGSLALLAFFPTTLLLVTIFLLVYYDEKNNFAQLFYSLPNNKIDILYSKYILTFGILILGLVVSYLVYGILNLLQTYEIFNLGKEFSLERGLEFNYFELIILLSLPIFIFPIYLKTKKTYFSVFFGVIALFLFGWLMFYLIFVSQDFILDRIIDESNNGGVEFILKYYIDIVSTVLLLVSSYLSIKYSKYLVS